jgi:hypothetical protein
MMHWDMAAVRDASSLVYFLREGAIYSELKRRKPQSTG